MVFIHGVDKSLIPTVNILGVDVAMIDMQWLIHFVTANLSSLSGDYLCVSNVYTTVMASEDKAYREIQNGGIMAIPDGGPLSIVGRSRLAGNIKPNVARTAGPDFMGEMLKIGGYRHYFYGSSEQTLEKLRQNLTRDYPQSIIAGMYSPPFRETTKEEDAVITECINAARADFVWVGLGAPKQEKWMATHQGRINGLMVGVGASFDYYAGNLKRAPEWMQERCLEWVYRLAQDPKRLYKRYIMTNTKFLWRVIIRGK